MALQRFCFLAQSPVGDVDYVTLFCKSPSTRRKVVTFVLAGVLLQNSGGRRANYERVPTVVVLLAVMDVRPGNNHRQGNTVLVNDDVSLAGCPASHDQSGFSLFFSPFSGAETV
jgi:hypothetical protein